MAAFQKYGSTENTTRTGINATEKTGIDANASPKTPNYRVVVKVGEKRWEKIGAAWNREDRISIQLNFIPLPTNGKLNFLLVPNDKKENVEKFKEE